MMRCRIEELRESLGVGGIDYSRQSFGASADIADKIDSIVGMESRLREMEAGLYREFDEACAVLYGNDNRGGVAKVVGTNAADVVLCRYLDNQKWDAIARNLGCTVRWCRMLADRAFTAIDKYGTAYMKEY